jgi:hypothetical protein
VANSSLTHARQSAFLHFQILVGFKAVFASSLAANRYFHPSLHVRGLEASPKNPRRFRYGLHAKKRADDPPAR